MRLHSKLMRNFILLFLILLQLNLWAQNVLKDSIVSTINLNEATIIDENDKNSTEFNFYRSNKLATTEDILSRMQGVNLVKRGAYGMEPTLRNYSSGQTNMTIDGMRIYGACTDKMDPISIYIEPINLKSLQVTQGAAGSLAGSTIGGQIDLNLKEPEFSEAQKISGQVAQSYSTGNIGSNTSFGIQHSANKIVSRISGTYRNVDDYNAPSNIKIPYSGYEKVNLSGMLKFKIDSNQTLKFDYLGDWGKNIGYPALLMDVGKANAQILAVTHRIESNRGWFKKNELKIYYNNIYHEMDDTHRENIPMHMDMPGWSNTVGFYDEFSTRNKLKFRMDFHRAYTLAEMTMYPKGEPIMYLQTLPENNLFDVGLAINQTINFKAKQELTINGRLDYFNQTANIGSGAKQWQVFNLDITKEKVDVLKNLSLAYSKTIGKTTFSQLTLSFGERIPTSNERYGFYLFNRQDNFDYLGNILLKPESALQAEMLVKHEFKRLSLSLNLFYHHTNNFIYAYQLKDYSQMTIGALGLKTYRNIDFATTKGFEFSAKANFTEDLTYLVALKYTYAQTYQNAPLPLVPPLKIQHSLRYELKLFRLQMEHDYGFAQNRINKDYGDKVTPNFSTFNFRVSRGINIKSSYLQIGAACENIFDKSYREHLDIGNIPRAGRNIIINLNFSF